jgi:hypothetical protein
VLRTNLATRPFYNDRGVRAVLVVAAAAALALTVFNVTAVWRLRAESVRLGTQASSQEAEARALRDKARQVRQAIDRTKLEAVEHAAREANLLIDRRAFSWTDLFNRFETTLPADVRISAVQPQVDPQGRMLVAVTVVARRVEDLDSFIEALEKTGAFRAVLSRQEEELEDGTRRSIIQGYYGIIRTGAAAAGSPASERETPAPTNRSATASVSPAGEVAAGGGR